MKLSCIRWVEKYKDYIVDEYDYKYSIQYRDRMKKEDSNSIHFVALNYEKPIRDIDKFFEKKA